jgi:hypothetical protein
LSIFKENKNKITNKYFGVVAHHISTRKGYGSLIIPIITTGLLGATHTDKE